MSMKLAPLTGVLYFVLLLVALLTGTDGLNASSSPEKVFAYYAAHRDSTRVSYVLTLPAVVVGVFFYELLRDYLRRHEASRGLTATAFGGVILFTASGAVSAGTLLALSDSPLRLGRSHAVRRLPRLGLCLQGAGLDALRFYTRTKTVAIHC